MSGTGSKRNDNLKPPIGVNGEINQGRCLTLFLANPGGGAHLSIFDGQGNLARIGVLNSQPTLLLRRAGNPVFGQPQAKRRIRKSVLDRPSPAGRWYFPECSCRLIAAEIEVPDAALVAYAALRR